MADVVAVEVDVEVEVAADVAVDLEAQAVMLPVPCLGRLCSVAIILTVLAQQAPKQWHSWFPGAGIEIQRDKNNW